MAETRREGLLAFADWISNQTELDVFTADEAVDLYLATNEVGDVDHLGCQKAFERAQSRARWAEHRLEALHVEINALSRNMDMVGGHRTHHELDGKTLGGAVRNLLQS